ncbi:MAG: alkaline phosphatase family protein [Saprospiraceae bacterium]|nr:alkaline phosphatase family protein [Saprospiraceae bacterium]
MKKYKFVLLIFISCILASNLLYTQEMKTQNVIFITLDGLRWQELFGGADDSLVRDLRFVKDTTLLKASYWDDDPDVRRRTLMPWMWNTVGVNGVLLGNQWKGSKVQVTNMHWFSYPGYQEILAGFSDPGVKSNDKIWNPNVTVLEWIQQKEGFQEKVAAFGSWDVFPYIINQQRNGMYINAGFDTASGASLTVKERWLNEIQFQCPKLWNGVRLDVMTHQYAMEYIQKNHPRLVYISYGETDDFAHDGKYDYYLDAAHRTDAMIAQLWDYCQQDPFYKNRTTFVITTDHGRGDLNKREWTSHGKLINGSNFIWIAAIGPDTPGRGEVQNAKRYFQNQAAKSVAKFLGFDYSNREEVGEIIDVLFSK